MVIRMSETERDDSENAIDQSELRDVVEEIRSWADQYADDYSSLSDTEKTTVASYHRCADEVEELVES